MSEAAIVPMAAGEKPTQPGWYVIEDRDGDREVAQVLSSMTRDGGFYVSFAGADMWDDLEDVLLRDKGIFIARIYPERIEARPER